MAQNRIFHSSQQLSLPVTHPTTPTSGDPVRFGTRVGVAMNDESTSITGECTVQFGGVYDVPVKGINAGGNSAVAVGDEIFYTDADTPPLSKKATGTPAGIALEAVTSGATATIRVAFYGF